MEKDAKDADPEKKENGRNNKERVSSSSKCNQ